MLWFFSQRSYQVISAFTSLPMSSSAQAAVTEHHRLSDLQTFLTFLETGSLRTGCQHSQVLRGGLPALPRGAPLSLLYPHMGREVETAKKRDFLFLVLIRALIPSWRPHLMTWSNPNYLPKASPLNSITVGIQSSNIRILGGYKHLVLGSWVLRTSS